MKYLGDYAEDATLYFDFNTHQADGTPITLAGSPVVKVYKDDATDSEVTTGVTLSVDHDSITGKHNVKIVLTDAFYETGADYSVVITTGTVDGTSVAGTVIATFSIENRYKHGTAQTGDTYGALPANFSDLSITETTGLVSLDSGEYQKSAQVIHGTKGTVWFVMSGGNDGNDGLTPTTAKASLKTIIEAASAADVVVIGPGQFALGANAISWTTRLDIAGAGMDLTTITSTITLSGDNQCIMNPGTGSRLSDFTIEGVGSTYQFPLGCDNSEGHDNVFTDVVCERIRLKADTDGLYFNTCFASPCEITMVECIIETMYDGLALLTCKDCKVTLIRTPVLVTGPSVIGAAGNSAHGVTITGSTGNIVKFIDSPVRVTDGGSTETIGIRINTSGSRVEMYGGSILTEAGEGNVYDADAEGASDVIVLDGVEYDRSKTSGSGTVTDIARVVANTNGAVTTDSDSRTASQTPAADIRAAVGMAEANLDTRLGTLATSSELVGGLFSLNSNLDGLIGTIGSPDGDSIAGDIAAVPTAVENRQEMDSNSTQFAAIVEDTGTTLPAAISGISTTIVANLSGNVTVTSPVTVDLDVEITQYDDYLDANGRKLTWNNSSGDWCNDDLTDATITFTVETASGTEVLEVAGEVVTATGTQVIGVELTSAQTALLTKEGQQYKYQLLVTKSTYRETVASGGVIVTLPFSEPD
jgi:hypothetical protein